MNPGIRESQSFQFKMWVMPRVSNLLYRRFQIGRGSDGLRTHENLDHSQAGSPAIQQAPKAFGAGWKPALREYRLASVNHLHFVVGEVFFGQRLHHLLALIVEAAQLARLVAR